MQPTDDRGDRQAEIGSRTHRKAKATAFLGRAAPDAGTVAAAGAVAAPGALEIMMALHFR